MNNIAGIHSLPSVAVVILNWNGRAFLQQFLPSVCASTYGNLRVIVADNCSTDDSLSFLRTEYPQLEVIINDKNYGFAKGYNEALAKVNADYYVLLNSDVEVATGWIEPIIHLMQSDDKIAACQPKILSYHNKSLFEYAGASGGWIDKFGYPFMRGRVFDVCETDHGQYNDVAPCFWASGASLFVKASAYHELNGLDEYFFAHQEEIDFCWRLQRSGYKVFVHPASVVYHVGGGTLPIGNSLKTYLNFRNNLVMMYKNLPIKERLWKIPFRFMLDALAAYKALFSGDGGYFIAILKAHFQFFNWVLFGKHKPLKQNNARVILAGWYNGSVVWDYFIQKKTTFFQIIQRK